ncbi:restriction endonuclease subunit S [Streptococcus sp.]
MTKQPSYRFVRYTEAWEQRKLGEVAQYRNGKAHENCIDENGKYIVVNSKFISTDGEVKKFSNKKNEALFENEIAFVLSDVPNGRAIARTFWVEKNDKYTLNQRIAGITPIGETFPYFLYILMNRHPYFLAFDDGAKQTNLSVSDVMGFEAYYPKYSEQQKIGAYFRNLDHLITLQQRKLEVLKEQKKTYLKLLFPAKGQTKPVLRFAGFEDEWQRQNFGDYLVEYNEKTVVENQHELLSSTNNGIEPRVGRVSGESNLGYKVLKKDMIVLSPQNLWLGNINYNSKYDLGIVSPSYKIFNIENVDKKFISILIRHPYMIYEYGQASVQGASVVRRNLDIDLFNSIQILLPSLEEQSLIGSFFQDLDKAIAKQEEKVNQLKESKQTLLRKMFI